MADHDDELERRFRDLDAIPAPDWRARINAGDDGIDLEPEASRSPRWPRPLAAAALAAAAVLLLVAVVAWPDDDEAPLVAGPAAGFGDLPPTDDLLVCPPALLDVGDLFEGVSEGPEVVSQPEMEGGPSPYTLRWVQEGREVTLSYPGPLVRTADLPPNEEVDVSAGRVARLEYRSRLTADVYPRREDGSVSSCDGFFIAVAGDDDFIEPPASANLNQPMPLPLPLPGESTTSTTVDDSVPAATQPIRDLVLDIASTVQIRPPDGAVAVPDVVGLDGIEAQDALARAGLIPGDSIIFDFDSRPVESVSPEAGTVVPIGTKVTLRLEPEPTTSTVPPTELRDVVLPMPSEPIVCPLGRLEVSGGVYSEPKVAFGDTLEWDGADQTQVQLTWPNYNYVFEDTGNRELDVNDLPALMLDGGDGQNLLYDTGLTEGPCRWIEVGVYGGGSIDRREELAIALATESITFGSPPDAAPPRVVGLTVADAADQLARAGFIPDWGDRHAIADEPTPPPGDRIVTSQSEPDENGVVLLAS